MLFIMFEPPVIPFIIKLYTKSKQDENITVYITFAVI